MKFITIPSQIDFIQMEKDLLEYWSKNGIVDKYLTKNNASDSQFSFLDGPITANNPMGVHHGWGRSYKDLWQRFYNMKGFKQRFQNGFDEQGLWVEVEVEKELGLKNKKDIENLVPGDNFASLEKFIDLCKQRVKKFSTIQTDQSKRLGYFMDWNNSYHTSSDENNYAIWHYLKVINEKGWLYKGHDSVPWCPRCGTAISQHEILTEEYKELTHDSVYVKFSVVGKDNEYLLVWTTTPWTIPANVAIAVSKDQTYLGVIVGDEKLWVMREAVNNLIQIGVLPKDVQKKQTLMGNNLVGWEYLAPFDNLERVKETLGEYKHRVIATDPQILPISEDSGTGLVHIAPGAGSEDFQLGRLEKLPVIEVIDEGAYYLDKLGDLTGKNAKHHPELIVDFLSQSENGKFLFTVKKYTHRYPTCWRCKTELVWRVVDEWYISMDIKDISGKTYREQMLEVIKGINWMPKWGYDRELDWLKNMHDWLISKKRYWGLALPFWECSNCGNFEVIGSKVELQEKAVAGWDEFAGHTPHKPWIDCVKLHCSKCQKLISRVVDVGNPWLDAGIVPFSTMPDSWFPADFVTEAFPGQFKNWFYSLIAMSTALKKEPPYKNLLGHAMVVDETGQEMHKSTGNSIEFEAAANEMGADIMRWMYFTQNPEQNLKFGYNIASEVKRRFYLILWNSYKYFLDYASSNSWECELTPSDIKDKLTILDKWVLASLTNLVIEVNKNLEQYDAMSASRSIENFVVNDLSTWYIRRSRDRVGVSAEVDDQRIFLATLYGVLVTISKILAPFVPFIAEEIFKGLTGEESVHLQNYPKGDVSLIDQDLIKNMQIVRKLAEVGHAKRKEANIKLRQPLLKFTYSTYVKLESGLETILADELNVKSVEYQKSANENELTGELDINISQGLLEEGEARELIRSIQKLRKEKGLILTDKVIIRSPSWPSNSKLQELIQQQTNSTELIKGEVLEVELINEQ